MVQRVVAAAGAVPVPAQPPQRRPRLVNKLGIWVTTEYERQAPFVLAVERIDEGKFTLHARNAADVPVEVHRVAFRIESVWAVQDRAPDETRFGVWTAGPGVDVNRHFAEPFLLAPDERVIVVDGQVVNVAHHAPEGATALSANRGITARVDWILVVDNAGRRWDALATGGRPAGCGGTAVAASTTRRSGRPGRSSW